MVHSYTARYTKIPSGYMGQILEWPEVITEGADIEECREMLKDAAQQMMIAYEIQMIAYEIQGKEIPAFEN